MERTLYRPGLGKMPVRFAKVYVADSAVAIEQQDGRPALAVQFCKVLQIIIDKYRKSDIPAGDVLLQTAEIPFVGKFGGNAR